MATQTITIRADARHAQAVVTQLHNSIRNIGTGAFGGVNAQLAALIAQLNAAAAAAGAAGAGAAGAGASAGRASGGFMALASSVARVGVAALGLGVLAGGLGAVSGGLLGAADAYGLLNAKLATVYKSTESFNQANDDVRRIAARTRSDLIATGNLYANLARQADNLGATQGQVAQVTQAFAMSLKVSGAGAQQAESAILQLSQAIGSGVLAGDEFRSIAETNAVFMEMLARSMGVAKGELKKLGSEGKITAQQIKDALTDPAIIADIEAQFGLIPTTFADIKTAVGSAMVDVAGSLKKGLGIDESLAVLVANIYKFGETSRATFERVGQAIRKAFDAIAPIVTTIFSTIGKAIMLAVNNMDALIAVLKVATVSFLAFKAASSAEAILTSVKAVIALERALGATGTMSALFSAGMKMAQGAANGLTAALLANPITAIATALTIVIGLLYQFSDQIGIGGGNVATLADIGAVVWEDISAGLGTLVDFAKSAFASIGEFFETFFSPIADVAKAVFGDLDLSFAGFLMGAARVIDGVIGFFRGGFNVVQLIWSNISTMLWPYVSWIVDAMKWAYGVIVKGWSMFSTAISSFFSSAFNYAAGIVQGFINKAISAINTVLGLANKLGLGIAPLSPVTLVAGAAVWAASGKETREAFNSGFGTGAQDGVANLLGRANQRRTRINAAPPGASVTTSPTRSTTRPGSPGGSNAGDGSGRSPADKAKDDLEAIKVKTAEFWTEMEEAVRVAGMLPLEAARYNEELKLRKILGGGILKDDIQLTDQMRERIALLQRQKTVAESITGIREATFKAENLSVVNSLRGVGLSERELEIEDALTDHRLKALAGGATLADITSDLWKMEEARLAAVLRQNQAFDEQRKKLADMQKSGRDLVERYSRDADPIAAARADRAKRDEAIRSVRPEDGESPEGFARRISVALQGSAAEFERDLQTANQKFFSSFTDSIDRLAQIFGGRFGEAIGSLVNLFKQFSAQINPDSSLGKLFGSNSKLVKGLEMFGQGAEMGAQIGNLAKAVGIKGFSTTGSSIGGGIGMAAFGPIGSVVGSVLGGIVGGLLSKPKKSSAGFTTDANGNVSVGGVSGSNAQLKQATSGAAGEVLSGLSDIARQLGGKLTGAPNLQIGTWDGKWRVNDYATSKPLHSKNFGPDTLHDFGEDQAAAVAYAIQKALTQGVITGLSDVVKKALEKLDASGAIQFAQDWTAAMDDFAAMTDPVAAAIKGVQTPLDALRETMLTIGASSEDLAKLEAYRAAKMDQLMKDQLSSLTDFQKQLVGQGSGITDFNRLNTDLAKFDSFKADIAAGKSIDQDAFTSLGQEIFQLASAVYGTSTIQFQDLRSMLMGTTADAVENMKATFNDATVVAIERTTEATNVTNEKLDRTNELLEQLVNGNVGSGGSVIGVNGNYFNRAAQV